MIIVMAVAVHFRRSWLLRLVLMRMLAIYDVRWYELVHDPGYNLYAEDTANEATDKDPRCGLGRKATIDQGILR